MPQARDISTSLALKVGLLYAACPAAARRTAPRLTTRHDMIEYPISLSATPQMMTHGALIGAVCAILPRWLMQWGAFPAGAGFFVAIFLVLRSVACVLLLLLLLLLGSACVSINSIRVVDAGVPSIPRKNHGAPLHFWARFSGGFLIGRPLDPQTGVSCFSVC